jgi:hypothetical protein
MSTGNLTFSCPVTAKAIESGISTDDSSLVGLRAVRMRLRCPHCTQEHDFTPQDGYLSQAA